MATQPAADERIEFIQPCTHAGVKYKIGDKPTLPYLQAKKLRDMKLATTPTDTPRQKTPRKRTRKTEEQ